VLNGNGVIAEVGHYRDLRRRHRDARLIDVSERLIVPGFIDTHVHLPQYGAMGLCGKELLEWLKAYIFPIERMFTPEAANTLCPIFFRHLLAHGVTTAAIYCSVQKDSTDVAFEWAHKIGIRAVIGKVMMDRNSPKFLLERTKRSVRESEELCRKWHGADNGRLMYAFSPRFAPACSVGLMEAAASLANDSGAYIQTHLSENADEVAWVKKLFPKAANYTDVYLKANLLRPNGIFAHAIHLSASERIVIKESGAALAHCPTSNLFLRSGLMALRELMDMGVPVGLGSDVAGGPTLSPFEVMRTAVYVHNARRGLSNFPSGDFLPSAAFYLATLGGARALRLDHRIGSLEAGKEADFVIVDPGKLNPLDQQRAQIEPDTLLSRLIFLGDDRVVEKAYVRGKLCHERSATGGRARQRAIRFS
jgi:guanine deaminase